MAGCVFYKSSLPFFVEVCPAFVTLQLLCKIWRNQEWYSMETQLPPEMECLCKQFHTTRFTVTVAHIQDPGFNLPKMHSFIFWCIFSLL